MINCAPPDGEPVYRSQQLHEFLGYPLEGLMAPQNRDWLVRWIPACTPTMYPASKRNTRDRSPRETLYPQASVTSQ